MFRFLKKIVTPKSSLFLTTFSLFTYYHFNNNQTKQSSLLNFSNIFSKVNCLETVRVNKIELINITNQTKQQVLFLIYNREDEDSLRNQILKFQQIAEKLNINKLILVDQTDLRHLQTFTKIMREDIEQQDKKQQQEKLPRNLQRKINIKYINPTFDTNKPFDIKSIEKLSEQIEEIRNILKINPSEVEIKKSMNTFNRSTIFKNCFNQTCVDNFKQKVRELIQLQLLQNKSENFGFYCTSTKSEANKISNIIGHNGNKQQILVFRNDILGKSKDFQTQFLQSQGIKYPNSNKFMMLIRPRVFILSQKTLTTDLFWYVSCLKNNSVPTFAINNTMDNFPIKYVNQQNQEDNNIYYIKGHIKQIDLLRRLKQKYGNNVQLLVINSNLPSQFLRHIYQPERYSIFQLTPQVPYPKLLIKPPTLNVDVKIWSTKSPIFQQQFEESLQNVNKLQESLSKEQILNDSQNYEQKWQQIFTKVDRFLQKPSNYSPVILYKQKQLQINLTDLSQKLKQSKQNKNQQNFVFRICGKRNSCLYSAYQKYGIDISIPIYTLDSNIQNVGIDEGDYLVSGSQISKLQ